MRRISIKLFLSTLLISFLFIHNSVSYAPADGKNLYSYKVVKKEVLKKGAQLKPLISPKYTLIIGTVALIDNEELTEVKVKRTIEEIISEIRRTDNPDAISIHLYLSIDHIEGSSTPFAVADWWPKGHSLSPNNKVNIENKSTHIIRYISIMLPEKVEESEIVNRMSESRRRQIFSELVKLEDRAQKAADNKYIIDASKIPIGQLRNYDWKTVFKKNSKEAKRLMEKDRKSLLTKHKISDEELTKISREAFLKDWPLPRYD